MNLNTRIGKGNNFLGKCINCHKELVGTDLLMEKVKFGWGYSAYLIICSKCQHIIGTQAY